MGEESGDETALLICMPPILHTSKPTASYYFKVWLLFIHCSGRQRHILDFIPPKWYVYDLIGPLGRKYIGKMTHVSRFMWRGELWRQNIEKTLRRNARVI